MLSVQAIYDGQHLQLLQKVSIKKPRRVIVVFLDDPENSEEEAPLTAKELHPLLAANPAFNFLSAEEEDIYSDADLKIKY